MAKRKTYGAGWRGSIGNVVHCTWMGIDYIRAKPAYVNDPQTEGQLRQRSRLKVCHALVSKLLYTVRRGFASQAVGMTAYNACMSRLMRQAVVVEQGEVRLDYRKVILGEGPLAVAHEANVSWQQGVLVVSWQTHSVVGNGSATDRVLLAIYNADKEVAMQQQGAALRGDGRCALAVPSDWHGDTLHCYLGFENQAQTDGSNIVHVGVATSETTEVETSVVRAELMLDGAVPHLIPSEFMAQSPSPLNGAALHPPEQSP